jgi:hypothetical protein
MSKTGTVLSRMGDRGEYDGDSGEYDRDRGEYDRGSLE